MSQRGVCRFCSCTWTKPCFPPCAWANRAQTVCSSARCLRDAAKLGLKLLPMIAPIARELMKLYPGGAKRKAVRA